jgi:hypothetical protein
MQSEFDKEIDSLLRESARRGRAAPAAPVEWGASERGEDGGLLRATPSGAHLDADEQNAYAENSLPASARTHYAAHLADCDVCRRSVTQLALAAGVPAQLEQQAAAATGREVLPGVSWRERFGALFAPRAWRYAVPALALLLVSAVTLIVLLRGRQSGEVSVARNNTAEQAKPSAPSETHHAPQNGSNAAATPTAGEGGVLSTSNSNAPVTREELAAVASEGQGEAKAGAIINETDAPPPPASSVGAASASAPAAADMPAPMPTPVPTPEPLVSTPEVEQKTKVSERADEAAKDVQKQQGNFENNQARERISGPRRNEQSRNMQRGGNISIARDGSDKNDAVLVATPTPAPPAATTAARRAPTRDADAERRVAGASKDSRKRESTPAPKPSAETRTVAGRKFRRAGSAWVDTAYTSQAVTVVRRNSEQFRALIADEPELRRISDALGGEVTVVWKGRAYRIR